jgi:DNA-binding Lrp family transcriptional regulator
MQVLRSVKIRLDANGNGEDGNGGPRLDQLDAAIAVALQANARATWREIGALVGASETTVARRARALIEQRKIQLTVSLDAVRCGLGNPVLLQILCENGKIAEVARSLVRRDDVRFASMVTGPFDVIAEFLTQSTDDLAALLIDELAGMANIVRTSTEIVLRNFKTSYVWAADILPRLDVAETFSLEGEPGDRGDLDGLDRALIRLLQSDGRAGYPQLASVLGISESAARRRLELLVGGGYMRPVALVSPRLLGFDVEAFVWLQVDLAALETIAETLGAYPGVRYLSATNGLHDLVAEVVLRSNAELYRFRNDVLSRLPGVRSFQVSLELRTLRRAHVELPTTESRENTT